MVTAIGLSNILHGVVYSLSSLHRKTYMQFFLDAMVAVAGPLMSVYFGNFWLFQKLKPILHLLPSDFTEYHS
jgi:hypothetical protein